MRNTISSLALTQYRKSVSHHHIRSTVWPTNFYMILYINNELLNLLFHISRVDFFFFIKILSFGKPRSGSKSKGHNLGMTLEA